jgi:hypothetical protein
MQMILTSFRLHCKQKLHYKVKCALQQLGALFPRNHKIKIIRRVFLHNANRVLKFTLVNNLVSVLHKTAINYDWPRTKLIKLTLSANGVL